MAVQKFWDEDLQEWAPILRGPRGPEGAAGADGESPITGTLGDADLVASGVPFYAFELPLDTFALPGAEAIITFDLNHSDSDPFWAYFLDGEVSGGMDLGAGTFLSPPASGVAVAFQSPTNLPYASGAIKATRSGADVPVTYESTFVQRDFGGGFNLQTWRGSLPYSTTTPPTLAWEASGGSFSFASLSYRYLPAP